jgi:hypothetical protein
VSFSYSSSSSAHQPPTGRPAPPRLRKKQSAHNRKRNYKHECSRN